MDRTKRVCPICRQKIDKPSGAENKFGARAKGHYPLELKFVTKKSLGKKPGRRGSGGGSGGGRGGVSGVV